MCSTSRKQRHCDQQDVDMNKDDRKTRDPVEQDTDASVRKNRERQDDDDRDSKKQRLPFVATSHLTPQRADVLKYWEHVIGGDLSAREVQNARQLVVETPERHECRGTSVALTHQSKGPQGAPSRSDGWTL